MLSETDLINLIFSIFGFPYNIFVLVIIVGIYFSLRPFFKNNNEKINEWLNNHWKEFLIFTIIVILITVIFWSYNNHYFPEPTQDKYPIFTSQFIQGNSRVDNDTAEKLREKTEPEIEIIHPDEKVDWQENIGGTAMNVPDNYELWILAYSKEKDQYYPITKVSIEYDEWAIQVPVGTEDDNEKKFDIIALLADKNAQNRFDDYVNKIEENNKSTYSQGIYRLPDGVEEYDRITVTRRDLFSEIFL